MSVALELRNSMTIRFGFFVANQDFNSQLTKLLWEGFDHE